MFVIYFFLSLLNCRCLWFKNAEEFQNLFLKFGKGLGSAIQKMELESVRMSINFCYRTDISVNDRKLIDLATETGNDDITRIITRATPYLVTNKYDSISLN